MKFCPYCGEKLIEGASFCSGCGKAIPSAQNTSTRQQEYVGKVMKCPNCGELWGGFSAICQSCGYELNSTEVSSALKDFIEQINTFEKTNLSDGRSGWKAWSISQKVGWIFLNVSFALFPLWFYLVGSLFKRNLTPKLTKPEIHMTSIIQNFQFPNDRASIIQGLIFVKEKIDFIAPSDLHNKTAYWLRLWSAKADQLKQKADLLFPDDSVVQSIYEEILSDKVRLQKVIRHHNRGELVKLGASIVVVTLLIARMLYVAGNSV